MEQLFLFENEVAVDGPSDLVVQDGLGLELRFLLCKFIAAPCFYLHLI